MREHFKRIIATAGILLLVTPVWGEVLDGIVVVINNNFIITWSDIRKERTIQSALGSKETSDDKIIDALVERHLVEEQMAQFREVEVPEDVVTKQLQAISTPPGVPAADLRDALVGELRRKKFLEERFQFIRVSDAELLKYFNDTYAPELRRLGQRVPPPEEGMEDVRQSVTALKMYDEIDTWMKELRKRSAIEKISK